MVFSIIIYCWQERLKEQERIAEEKQLDLKDRLIALTRQLDSLEDFRQNKEQLEAKLKQLESTLETERQEHQEEVIDYITAKILTLGYIGLHLSIYMLILANIYNKERSNEFEK